MNRLDITILVAAGFVAAASLAAARRWPFGVRLQRRWQQVEPYLGAYIRRSPATFTYAGIIAVTTWVVAGLNARTSDALLRAQSTNLDNLRTHPLDVLFRSMFFSGSTAALPVVALIAAVLAPAEVWLGSARLIFVFVAGHVGATLITALALSQGYYASAGDFEIDRAIDVGVSYGLFCVAAVLFSWAWRRKYARGPLEILMRRLSATSDTTPTETTAN